MTLTVVHLLRHGKVQNPDNILYGRLPGFVLADSGIEMAEAVAAHLAENNITRVSASSLERAQQTAAPIAASHGLTVGTDDRVIEAANQFEGSRVAVRDGALVDPRNWMKLRDPFTPSWGEAYLDIAHRMLGAIYAAVDAAAGSEAVIVSHQLPIVSARRFLAGQRLWHNPATRECSVASITSLRFEDGVYQGDSYAEPAAHIPAVNNRISAMGAL
ncbi:histidine phosphatase family protein [Nakamurella antarctica]|uniref:Histidine phosphatase family protein n=1 Tax=Nakamurella antarctica TaxID=1902245 RepID=A0A3G8ZN77_9ACTN|nr:histidine phosphatase family protein [Nakamurella antarctica]AZI58759.1 histidine phosphatase family protein [Nakamurella antarctica]